MGPFNQWPSAGGGFEYFYGFLGAEADGMLRTSYKERRLSTHRRRRKRVITSTRTSRIT